MKKLALFLSMMMAVSFTACQSQPPTKSWSSASPAPESPAAPESATTPESPAAPESSSQPEAPEDKEAPALLYYDEGVEVTTLMTWEPGQQEVEIPFPAFDDKLLVEVQTADGTRLVGYDLAAGGEVYTCPLTKARHESRSHYYRVMDAPGWEIKIFDGSSYRHDSWTHPIGSYTLPEALQEGRQWYRCGWDWDAQPEKDLLTWTDPEGLWLAKADGSDARLLLATEEAGPYLEQWGMTGEDGWQVLMEKDKDIWERLGILSPRLINGGQTIAADFGVPGNLWGHNGLVVVDIATGRADWYNHYIAMTADSHEYLDDTHILMGNTMIDITSGETTPAWRWTLTDEGPLYTGNFSRYFGNVDLADGGKGIIACTLEDWNTAQPFLTANEGYSALYPFLRSAIDDRQVVCRYQKPDEEGLLLVTLPES